jgi:hypothetical protein
MTFQLGRLGPYRIERSEEYIPGGSHNSYAELIRVRGSRPEPPSFMVPSHLYKHSETELGLYLKERKNLWMPLGKILNQRIDIHDHELMVHFPVTKFKEVARVVPFVRKKTRVKPMTEDERRRATLTLEHFRLQNRNIIEQNDLKTGGKDMGRHDCTNSPPSTLRGWLNGKLAWDLDEGGDSP